MSRFGIPQTGGTALGLHGLQRETPLARCLAANVIRHSIPQPPRMYIYVDSSAKTMTFTAKHNHILPFMLSRVNDKY